MIDVSSPQLRNYTTASLQQNLVAGTGLTSVPPRGTSEGGTAAKTIGPAAVVDLSDRPKAAIERNRMAQDVADRLAQQVAVMKDADAKTQGSAGHSNSTSVSKDGSCPVRWCS